MTNSCYSGTIQSTRSDIYFTPCYYVMQAYASLAGDQALGAEVEADESLDLSATRHSSEGQVVLFVGSDSDEPQARTIALDGLRVHEGPLRVWTLTGTSLDAVNSFQEKRRVCSSLPD